MPLMTVKGGRWSAAGAPAPAPSPAPAGGLPVDFTLTSASGGANLPWAFGHAFAQGDVPSGSDIVSAEAEFQATIVNRWPDDSAKFAVIAGRSTLSAGTPKTISLDVGTAAGGSNVALSALQAAVSAGQYTVALGSYGTVDLYDAVNGADLSSFSGASGTRPSTAGRLRQFIAGPVMSEWHFYSPAPSDSHLAVFWYCRTWATGELEIEFSVENGWLNVSSPGERVYSPVVTINGTSRYSPGSLTHKHHTRWGMPFWANASMPEVVPKHDAAYLRSTRLVPNYGYTTPQASAYSGYASTISAFGPANLPTSGMGASGDHPWVGPMPTWDAHYAATGDATAYRAVVANGYAFGMFGFHYRDEATLRAARPTQHPTLALPGVATVGSNTPTPSGGTPPDWKDSHQPAAGYLAALVTGRWSLAEVAAFATAKNVFDMRAASFTAMGNPGRNSQSILIGQVRSVGWILRNVAMAGAVAPAGDAWETESVDILANNFAHMRAYFVDGTLGSGVFVNPFGVCCWYVQSADGGTYSDGTQGATTEAWDGPWQHNFLTFAIAFASELGLPFDDQGASDLYAVRTHAYKWARFVTGEGGSSAWCYRRAGLYTAPYTSNYTGARDSPTWLTPSEFVTRYFAFKTTATDTSCALSGATLLDVDLDTAADAGNFTGGSGWSSLIPVLAYARDHGAISQTAYDRIIGASTYTAISQNLSDDPRWAVLAVSAARPAYITAPSTLTWTAIEGTDLSTGDAMADLMSGTDFVNTRRGITAYCGAAFREGRAELLMTGGGHADYSGNDVYRLRLSDAAPAWVQLRRPTPVAQYGYDATSGVEVGESHYADTDLGGYPGRPASRHTYAHNQFIAARNRLMLFGAAAVAGNGNGAFDTVDGFRLDTNDYDPAGTFTGATGIKNTSGASCKDASENVYRFTGPAVLKWTQTSGAWTTLDASPGVSYMAMVYDPVRNRVVRFTSGTGQHGYYDLSAGGAKTLVTLTGAAASSINGFCSPVWCEARGTFLVMPWWQTSTIYEIDPVTWAVTTLSVSNASALPAVASDGHAQYYQRFFYSPELKAVFLWCAADTNVYFFRVA